MKKNLAIIFLSAIIILYVLFRLVLHSLDDFGFKVVSSKEAPNGRFTITEVQSMSEGGHAPYGTELLLTPSRGSQAKGYVIYAGYCNDPLEYSWETDTNIKVICNTKGENPIITRAVKAYEINIEVLIK